MLTKEEYKKVKELENIFFTYVKSKYCTRLTVDKLQFLKVIYEKEVKRTINISCDSCVLTLCKIMIKKINEYEEFRKNQKNIEKQPDSNNDEGTQSNSTNRKKRGRPSKATVGEK